jgi:hypothetical protein
MSDVDKRLLARGTSGTWAQGSLTAVAEPGFLATGWRLRPAETTALRLAAGKVAEYVHGDLQGLAKEGGDGLR